MSNLAYVGMVCALCFSAIGSGLGAICFFRARKFLKFGEAALIIKPSISNTINKAQGDRLSC